MYLIALAGVTRYALSEAVKAIVRGALGHTFFPSPVELKLECDRAQRPVDEMERRIRITEEQRRERERGDRFNAARTPEARERVADIYAKFCAGYQNEQQAADEAERAEIRARYGMTDEAVASIADQPIPTNFKKLGAA